MSEQDADAESETPSDESATAEQRSSDGEHVDDQQPSDGVLGGDAASEDLEEIAERPAGDVEEILSTITETEPDETGSSTEQTIDPALVDVVESTPPEELVAGITALREKVDQFETELAEERERADDLESRLKRKQADFQNYKKRQEKRMEEEKQRATEDLVGRLLDVRDNLHRALEQDSDTDIRGGVESTLEQFNQELDKENVDVIEPELGSEVDPRRHEVLVTVASDQPEDTVADLHRPGYEMAGKVLRPAQVAVSDGSEHDSSE